MASTTIIDEMRSAARGVLALIVGDRRAPQHFDFSQRGLYGSFIALLSVNLMTALVGVMLGGNGVGQALVQSAILVAFQLTFAAIALRQMKRLDGFVPFLVADNWATFFVGGLLMIVLLVGVPADFAAIAIGIATIIIVVNSARLIVTLSPLQIAAFLVAQLVGFSIGLLMIGMLFPPSPEEIAAIEETMRALRQ